MSLDAQISVEVVAIAMFLCFLAVSLAKDGRKKLFSSLNWIFILNIVHSLAIICSNIIDLGYPSVPLQYIG